MISTKNGNLLRCLICAKWFTKCMKIVKFDFMFSKDLHLQGYVFNLVTYCKCDPMILKIRMISSMKTLKPNPVKRLI